MKDEAHLLFDRHAAASQFDGERSPVRSFQKAVSQFVVDVNKPLDDVSREVL